LIRRRLIF